MPGKRKPTIGQKTAEEIEAGMPAFPKEQDLPESAENRKMSAKEQEIEMNAENILAELTKHAEDKKGKGGIDDFKEEVRCSPIAAAATSLPLPLP